LSIFEELRVLDDRDELRTPRYADSDLLQPAFAAPSRSFRRTVELVMRATLRGALTAGAFDIVIVGSSVGLTTRRDGRWFDRINDYFAMAQPERTLVLDMATRDGYKTPRFPPNVRCYDTFDVLAGVAARARRPRDADLTAIDRMVAFIRAQFPLALPEDVIDRIRAQLVHFAVRLPTLESLFQRFFDRVRPRVMIFEDGSYGGFSHVMHWARRAGIATAENQHGVIAHTHLAYNYGAFDATYLPEYLLLYGEHWGEELRTPSKRVVIGCPHFTETALGELTAETILIISQGIRTDALVQLALAVARRFPDRRCVFRVHPGELAFPERYAALRDIANVEISEGGDIYQHLRRARVVIGHSSMALYEAAGMGLTVLILDDDASRINTPSDLGTWFRSAGELLALVESPPAARTNPERFFARDWRARYRSFIESL
jgi:hypothetical protein